MTDYVLAEPDSMHAIGGRAKRLRALIGMTSVQVASETETTEDDVTALEPGGIVSLATALAIHRVLSAEGAGDMLLTVPDCGTSTKSRP